MTEEQIKNWAREKANALEENQTLGIYDRDEDMRYDEGYNDGQVSGYEEGLIEGYKEGFKDCAKSRLNVTTISDCPIKVDWHYVKDEGTPIHEGHYLVCLRNKNHDILDCWILFDKDVGWYSLQVRLVDIYAWKEIVLPELPKERE